jgi:hypothetical protein
MLSEKDRLRLAMETLIAEFPGSGFLYDIGIRITRSKLDELDEFRSAQVATKMRRILNGGRPEGR